MSKGNFPSKDARESYLQLVAVLDAYGIKQHSLSFNASNHPVLVFTAGGREHKLVLAGSPSDHRSSLNARATLVRILRASGVAPISDRPKAVPEEALDPDVAEADPELAADSVEAEAEAEEPAEEPATAADQSEEELPEEVEASAAQPIFETAEPTPQDEPIAEPVAASEAEQWDETIVRFARGRQLLFEPMPRRSVLALTLDQDLIAEKNGKLIIDLHSETVRFLPEKQFDAVFRSAKEPITTLADAVAHIVATPPAPEPRPAAMPAQPARQPQPASRPSFQREPERQRQETRPRVTPRFVPPPRASTPTGVTGRVKGMGAQLGRLLVTMHFLHRNGERLIDTGMLAQHMPPRDTKSISSQLYFARQRGFVETEGFVPGHVRAYYYRLTSEGAAKARSMGNAPFEIAGLRPPSVAAAE